MSPIGIEVDIGQKIFSWLDLKTLNQARLVRKAWKSAADHELLWKDLYQKELGKEKQQFLQTDDSWKSRFKLFYNFTMGTCLTTSYQAIPNQLSLNQVFLQLKAKPRDQVVDFHFNSKELSLQIDLLGSAQPITVMLTQSLKERPAAIALTADYVAIAITVKIIQIFDRKTGRNF